MLPTNFTENSSEREKIAKKYVMFQFKVKKTTKQRTIRNIASNKKNIVIFEGKINEKQKRRHFIL